MACFFVVDVCLLTLSLLKKSPASFGFQSSKFYLHSTAETEELKQKRINGSYQDLSKLTAETEFRGSGNRINGGESVFDISKVFFKESCPKNHVFLIHF